MGVFFQSDEGDTFKVPRHGHRILVAKILLRNMVEALDCISSYLGHSNMSREHQSAAWCAQDLYNTALETLYFGQLSIKDFQENLTENNEETGIRMVLIFPPFQT